MTQPRYLTRGVLLNWMAFSCSVGISFFLSPFVVHRLGNGAYGVWTLINALVAYMGLLDFGLRGAVTRFVAWDVAQGNYEEAGRTVSTTLWIRCWMGGAVVVVSLVLALCVPVLFAIPVELQPATRWALSIAGISAALNLICGVFGGILAALQRYDLLSTVTIGQVIVRSLGVLWALRVGYGIVVLAVVECICATLANAVVIRLCFRECPYLHIAFGQFDRAVLQRIWQFSLFASVITMSSQVIHYTDTLVVGAFLSVGAVTFYAIGGGLIEYTLRLVQSLTMTYTPLASDLGARGHTESLQHLLIHGTRIAILVGVPVQVALFLRGGTFINLWMGAEYVQVSSRVLQILLIAQFFIVANMSGYGVAFGLEKHRPVALVVMMEALANLALSIVLVRWLGLEGVAWGTVIPSLVTQLIFWPGYVRTLVGLSPWLYIQRAWVRAYASVIPFTIACYWVDRHWTPPNLLFFFVQMALLLPFLVVGIGCCFPKEARDGWRSRPAWLLPVSRAVPSLVGKS